MQPPSINSAVSALRFFFTVTLDRPDLVRRLTVVPQPRRIPVVLSVEEVTLLRRAASALKYKAAFATAGACPRAGQRAGPVGRRAAPLGSRRVEGRRHRFRAHAAARRARQGRQGPPRNAVAAAARTVACLVVRRATAQPAAAGRLAVSRPQPRRAAVDAPAWPRCPRRHPDGRDQQARVAAHAAAQLCHPPARARRRCPCDPDAPRPRQARHHGTLHALPVRRSGPSPARSTVSHP
jgi:hypothetical protein